MVRHVFVVPLLAVGLLAPATIARGDRIVIREKKEGRYLYEKTPVGGVTTNDTPENKEAKAIEGLKELEKVKAEKGGSDPDRFDIYLEPDGDSPDLYSYTDDDAKKYRDAFYNLLAPTYGRQIANELRDIADRIKAALDKENGPEPNKNLSDSLLPKDTLLTRFGKGVIDPTIVPPPDKPKSQGPARADAMAHEAPHPARADAMTHEAPHPARADAMTHEEPHKTADDLMRKLLPKIHELKHKRPLTPQERLLKPFHKNEQGASNAEAGPLARVATVNEPKTDSVGGVRLHYDSATLHQAVLAGTSAENFKLLQRLEKQLGSAKEPQEQLTAVRAYFEQLKVRLKTRKPSQQLDNLRVVSLRFLVEKVESFRGDTSALPAELRNPGGIARVHGFVIGPERGDIFLIGSHDPQAPALELDDLIVATRAIWKERGVPTCSLDPDPDDIAAGRAGPQKVRLLGVPCDSGFAKTMLDADYEMKRIVFGTAPTDVPGHQSLKELIRRSPNPAAEVGNSRFWFYPVSPGPGQILAAPDGRIFLFSSGLQLLTEQVMFTREGMVGTGKVQRTREEAAESFNRHFGAIAARKPIFRKLQTLSDLVLLANLWKEMGLRSDLLDRLCSLPHRSVAIADSYAGIREDVINTQTVSFWLVGGVEMRMAAGPRSWLVLEDAEIAALRRKARQLTFADAAAQALTGLTLRVPLPSRDTRRQTAVQAVQAALRGGDLKSALQAADHLVAADPWDAEAFILRALVHLRRADYSRARRDAENARALEPTNSDIAAAVANILFQCHWMQGNPDGALRAIDMSLHQNPQRADAQVARAEVLMLLGKADEARKVLTQAVQLNRASALPCARLAQLELAEGRTLDAKPWVQKALALDPFMPEVRIASAHWELATIRPDLAEKIAREVWESEANSPTVRLQALAILASISAAREKWNDVDRYVGLMDRLSAGSPEVLVVAAEIAATWGERQRAAAYLEKAEKLSPTHPLVRKLRARLAK